MHRLPCKAPGLGFWQFARRGADKMTFLDDLIEHPLDYRRSDGAVGNPKLYRWTGDNWRFPGANKQWKAIIPPQQMQLAEQVLPQWCKRKPCYLIRLQDEIARSGCSVWNFYTNMVVILREMRDPPR